MVIAVLSHAVNPGNSKVLAFTGTRVSLSYCCAHAVLMPFCTYCVFSTTASPLSYDFCIALSISESSHKKLESPCSMFLNSSKVPVVTSSLKVTASTSQPLQPPLFFCVESRYCKPFSEAALYFCFLVNVYTSARYSICENVFRLSSVLRFCSSFRPAFMESMFSTPAQSMFFSQPPSSF